MIPIIWRDTMDFGEETVIKKLEHKEEKKKAEINAETEKVINQPPVE